MERYPKNISIDIEDFRDSAWKAAVNTSNEEGYFGMWISLCEAAKNAVEKEKFSEGKVLWLLADACSMLLNPRSLNEPFKPFMLMGGNRSSLPEDFHASDIALFSQFSEEVDDIRLQARLADLVWLLSKPRSFKHALLAIDAYRQIPLDTETWVSYGRDCWTRAISLSRKLKAAAGERMKEIEAAIIEAFDAARTNDGFLALWLSDVLEANSLGRDSRGDIAGKLEGMARDFDSSGDLHRARGFFNAASKWFRQLDYEAKAAEMTACVAEGWVKEAIASKSSERPNYIAATSFYENAIQTYRAIPRRERTIHRVDERISAIHKELIEAGARSLDELCFITSPPLDITEMVENAGKTVKGKINIEALKALVNIYQGPGVEEIRKYSEKMLNENPLQAFISATHMSRDGRVIAKRAGIGCETSSTDYEAGIWEEMVRYYGLCCKK